MKTSFGGAIILCLILGIAIASESSTDCQDEKLERSLDKLRELYTVLLQDNSLDNLNSPISLSLPDEQLMIRKSQRSPSMRLRYGRSSPVIPPVHTY